MKPWYPKRSGARKQASSDRIFNCLLSRHQANLSNLFSDFRGLGSSAPQALFFFAKGGFATPCPLSGLFGAKRREARKQASSDWKLNQLLSTHQANLSNLFSDLRGLGSSAPRALFFLRRGALRHHALYQTCLVRNEEKHESKPQAKGNSKRIYPNTRESLSNLFSFWR